MKDWLSQEGADPNQRDHTGRTALHLAVTCSTPEIVRCLVVHGCRLVARLADGRTALHLAAARGNVEVVNIIMEKSEANEAEEEMKEIRRKDAKKAAQQEDQPVPSDSERESNESENPDEVELLDDDENSEDGVQSIATGSFVKVPSRSDDQSEALPEDNDEDEPDFYDVNVLTWDTKASPLHLAIINGHSEVAKALCQTFGADILLPVKLLHDHDKVSIFRWCSFALLIIYTVPSGCNSHFGTCLDFASRQCEKDGHHPARTRRDIFPGRSQWVHCTPLLCQR